RWQSPRSRLNHYVRLFDRRRARMNGLAVHETVAVDGPVRQLDVMIDHYGERNIAGRTHKANLYSSLQVDDLQRRGVSHLRLRMVGYSWVAFVRYYFLRGHWREGRSEERRVGKEGRCGWEAEQTKKKGNEGN